MWAWNDDCLALIFAFAHRDADTVRRIVALATTCKAAVRGLRLCASWATGPWRLLRASATPHDLDWFAHVARSYRRLRMLQFFGADKDDQPLFAIHRDEETGLWHHTARTDRYGLISILQRHGGMAGVSTLNIEEGRHLVSITWSMYGSPLVHWDLQKQLYGESLKSIVYFFCKGGGRTGADVEVSCVSIKMLRVVAAGVLTGMGARNCTHLRRLKVDAGARPFAPLVAQALADATRSPTISAIRRLAKVVGCIEVYMHSQRRNDWLWRRDAAPLDER